MAIMALAAAAAALTLPDALAEDDDGAAAEAAATLVSRLKALRPDIPIENVTASPIPGIYALELAGGTVFYGTEDGRYLFAGDLYQLGDDELVNLAEAGRAHEATHEPS